ncbi:hypothetical protein FH972_009720 [Carpinus fangiana]|uniref:BTB domain-containing protein n=1 Tax=Carpinus fangiana TaxID=176857 RepID=A0A660KL39_9ROSI|nr:hypothetical protein FH972_009720 [Carpinus fangiana]
MGCCRGEGREEEMENELRKVAGMYFNKRNEKVVSILMTIRGSYWERTLSTSTDLFDPRKVMASNLSSGDFMFGFNDSNFSDRVLRIEILGDPQENRPDSEDIKKENGDEAGNGNDVSTVVRVETLHINSLILASKSSFFYTLFSNWTRESKWQLVTLRINAMEEAALMELLKFMYGNTLSITTVSGLLDVVVVADKFAVASCVSYCCTKLLEMPNKLEAALLFLELPSCILMGEEVRHWTDTAKRYLACYKDLAKFPKEVMALPLAGMAALLSSDDLQVPSEDAAYYFMLKWARAHYPKLEERREVLGLLLASVIRFPYLSHQKLMEILRCPDFDPDVSNKLVVEALFFNAGFPHLQRILAAEEAATSNHHTVERAYIYRPVKVVELDSLHQQYVVYLDLKREKFLKFYENNRMYSQAFHLGGQMFDLLAKRHRQKHFSTFGLFLRTKPAKESGTLSVESFTIDLAHVYVYDQINKKKKGNNTFSASGDFPPRHLLKIRLQTAFFSVISTPLPAASSHTQPHRSLPHSAVQIPASPPTALSRCSLPASQHRSGLLLTATVQPRRSSVPISGAPSLQLQIVF